MLRRTLSSAVISAVLLSGISVFLEQNLNAAVLKKETTYQGELGKVIVNPYKVAPLTAVIDRNGKTIANVKVTVEGKPDGGVPISYSVSDNSILNHDGIPIFGLYEDYINVVKVEYDLAGKKVVESYKIRTNPFTGRLVDGRLDRKPVSEIKTVSKGFEDRLYLASFMAVADSQDWAWSNKQNTTHGSGEWSAPAEFFMVDTKGEIRWFLDTEKFYDKYGRSIDDTGRIMSFHQYKNGDILIGQAQKYYRMNMLGEVSFERKLPRGYVDLSHEALPMDNGHILLRVAKKDYHIPGTNDVATTIRDIVIEVDDGGRIVDEWDFNKIMDKDVFRKDLIMALDARAVCLNVDVNAKHIEVNDAIPYGDHASTGTGRNWAHINSIDYDKNDDSLIISMRHQGILKVGRDKQIKWVLASPVGWSEKMKSKILTPVDVKGKKLNCENSTCSGTNFDWSWTQHTAWLSNRGKNDKQTTTLSVFDNGDGRGMDQPVFKEDKYSRAVEYTIDEKNLTVYQSWEFGKERGNDFYSAVTSNVTYENDTKTYSVCSGNTKLLTKERTKAIILEIDPKNNDVKLEMSLSIDKKPGIFYRAQPIKASKLFQY